jgi:hypothetical protein
MEGATPTLWVQLRSAFIHEVGLERAIEEGLGPQI